MSTPPIYLKDFLDKIDPELLREQRQELLAMLDETEERACPERYKRLLGLIHMTDYIADLFADVLDDNRALFQ